MQSTMMIVVIAEMRIIIFIIFFTPILGTKNRPPAVYSTAGNISQFLFHYKLRKFFDNIHTLSSLGRIFYYLFFGKNDIMEKIFRRYFLWRMAKLTAQELFLLYC